MGVEACAIQAAGRSGVTYEHQKNTCYWDYLRIYTPMGSTLNESSPFPMPEGALYRRIGYNDIDETRRTYTEAEKSVFAGFFNLAPGRSKSVAFEYSLPSRILRTDGSRLEYSLFLQKQPGTISTPVDIKVRPPDGYCVRRSTPESTQVNSDEVHFLIDLTSDTIIEISFEPKSHCELPDDNDSGASIDLPEGITRTAFGPITVEPATAGSAPSLVQVSPHHPLLVRGQRFLFTAVVLDSLGLPVQDAELHWRIKNPTAGSISATGLFTAGLPVGRYEDAVEVTAISPRGTASAGTSVEIVTEHEAQSRQLDSVILYPSEMILRPDQVVGIAA